MKKLAILLACVLMMTFACAAVAESVSIAIVYSDTVDDKGWCQSMDNGVKNAIAKGYEIDYTPVESVQVLDAPNTLDQLAENYDIIIELINRTAEGKTGAENIPLNYNNGGFIYTFSENAELMLEETRAAAQAALDTMLAAPNTVDFSGIELK